MHYEVEITVRLVKDDVVVNEDSTVFTEQNATQAGSHAERSTEGMVERLADHERRQNM